MTFNFLPELFLFAFMIFSVFLKFIYDKEIKSSSIFLIAAAICLFPIYGSTKYSVCFFSYKYYESILKTLLLFSSAILCKFVYDYDFFKQLIVLLSVIGAMLALSSCDFLSLLLSLEFSMIPVLINRKALNVSNKYILYWILSTVILIIAIFLMYTFVGTTNFNDIRDAFSYHQGRLAYLILTMIFISFCIKIGTFLLHFGILDSFKNGLQSVSIIFCIMRMTVVIVFYKIITVVFFHIDISHMILFISCISLVFGSILIFRETNLNKILAYFIVYNSGIILLCCSCKTHGSMKSILYFTVSEMISMLGIFVLLTNLKRNKNQKIEYINDLSGISSWNPLLATSVSILFLSLFGIAPFIGFWNRFFLCLSLFSKDIILPAIIYVFSFAINLICLGKIINAIWFKNLKDGIYFMSSNENLSRVICFLSFLTILSIPVVHKLVYLMRMEIY